MQDIGDNSQGAVKNTAIQCQQVAPPIVMMKQHGQHRLRQAASVLLYRVLASIVHATGSR